MCAHTVTPSIGGGEGENRFRTALLFRWDVRSFGFFFLLFLHSTSVVSCWFLLNRAIALFSYIEFQSCLLCLSERVSNLTPLELNLPHTQWERTPTVAGGKEIKCPLGVPALHEVKSHSHWRPFLLRSQC